MTKLDIRITYNVHQAYYEIYFQNSLLGIAFNYEELTRQVTEFLDFFHNCKRKNHLPVDKKVVWTEEK